jgi:hypothetical protein
VEEAAEYIEVEWVEEADMPTHLLGQTLLQATQLGRLLQHPLWGQHQQLLLSLPEIDSGNRQDNSASDYDETSLVPRTEATSTATRMSSRQVFHVDLLLDGKTLHVSATRRSSSARLDFPQA